MTPPPQQRPRKTYFLSNFEAAPGGRISLGNIFEDPFSINEECVDTLSKPTANEDLEFLEAGTQTLPSENESVRESRSRSWSAQLWAKFVALLHLEAGAQRSTNSSVVYEIDEMRTVWLDDGIRAYANEPVARESGLNAIVNGVPPAPVYMIVGIKYAKGLRVWIEEGASSSASAKADMNLSGDGFSASGGGGGGAGHNASRTLARQINAEVVFAYRLAEITRTKVATVQEGFMSDRKKDVERDSTLSYSELSADEERVRHIADSIGVERDCYELGILEPAPGVENEQDEDIEFAHLFLTQ